MIIDAPKGSFVFDAVNDAIITANKAGEDVELKFNDILLIVRPTSNALDICTIYNLELELSRVKFKTRW